MIRARRRFDGSFGACLRSFEKVILLASVFEFMHLKPLRKVPQVSVMGSMERVCKWTSIPAG